MEDITPIAAGLEADLALMALDAWDVIVHAARGAAQAAGTEREPAAAALARTPQLVHEQPGMAVIA